MKILGIFFLILFVLMGFSIGLDVLLGYGAVSSFKHALNPFHVKEEAEIIIFFIMIFGLGAVFKKKKKNEKKGQQPEE